MWTNTVTAREIELVETSNDKYYAWQLVSLMTLLRCGWS